MQPDSLTLAFDTSVAHCAAALLCGDKVLHEMAEPLAKGQAERLFPLLQELLAKADVGWKDLARIGVGVGPGNFTGIRISVSAARGLALSCGIPAVGVSSLAAQAEGLDGPVISVLDARNGNYYFQSFGNLDGAPPTRCTLETLPQIPARADPAVVGFEAALIAKHYAGHICLPIFPTAVAIGRIANRQKHDTKSRPVPLYLRAPDAAPPKNPAPAILP
ncbi:MAG: tRNA (adenosine(37)-N6)-threonylcarbamoyltransferase complex dimerization subunit type 1 TsaB [Marinosulfonomonas sp.]|nr:tRNA (adenosine(37)-N6)-threonylcarbamoyltransferase complex dimerization subunit type 1 TsaB [Marinosulfonomonas sp.]